MRGYHLLISIAASESRSSSNTKAPTATTAGSHHPTLAGLSQVWLKQTR
jgi:hypothetical protein